MKTAIELTVYLMTCVIGLVLYGATVHFKNQSTSLPANGSWVTSKADPELYEQDRIQTESYGKFQLILAPERMGFGTDLTGWESDESMSEDSVKVLFQTTNGIDVMMNCHSCFGFGDVSGGIIKLKKQHQKWTLYFKHVGAESQLFADAPPPDWAQDLFNPMTRAVTAQSLLDTFSQLYQARDDLDIKTQKTTTHSIVSDLLKVFADRHGFSTPGADVPVDQ